MYKHEWKYHTILYEGLAMNEEMLPAVIFTNCDAVPENVERDYEGKVVYLPDMSAPSGDMTLRWLEEVKPWLEDEPLLVHDKGPEYTSQIVKEELKELGIKEMAIPAAGGAFINPCDNPFNSQLRRA